MMLHALLSEELQDLSNRHLMRTLRVLTPGEGAYAFWEGRKILLCCGNDYLGLSKHPRVIAAVQRAAGQYGTGAGASRLISGTFDYHRRAEDKIARFKGKDQALLLSSGYAANLGLLSALAGPGDLIILDKLCHASLIDGAKLSGATVRVFPHKNYERLDEILQKNSTPARKLIVTDTVFSMDGDVADLPALVCIKEKHGAWLVADDAHGTGVLGRSGKGAADSAGVEGRVDVLMGTSSKALGSLGGFIAASETTIQYLINHARSFIYSTAMPAMLCAAIEEAITVLEEEPGIQERLWSHIRMVNQSLNDLGLFEGEAVSPIFPVMIGSEEKALRVSSRLLEAGILIPAVRTPTVPKGKARLRLTVSALHQEEDLANAMKALRAAL